MAEPVGGAYGRGWRLTGGPAAPGSSAPAKVVRSATGSNSETLDRASFDMRLYAGKQAQIQIVDMSTAGWGHLLADRFTAADTAAKSVVQRADWADYGKDYCAAVSWENTSGGKQYAHN